MNPYARRDGPEVFCACGESILFGPAATAEDRAAPICGACERLTEEALASLTANTKDSEDGDLVSSGPIVTEA